MSEIFQNGGPSGLALSQAELSDENHGVDPPESSRRASGSTKRKRSTIACTECRLRKRKCNADRNINCENCSRDGLKCVKPDIDGRKARWHKGNNTTEADEDGSSAQPEIAGKRQAVDGDSEGNYAGRLLDLIMGSSTTRTGPAAMDQSTSVATRDSSIPFWDFPDGVSYVSPGNVRAGDTPRFPSGQPSDVYNDYWRDLAQSSSIPRTGVNQPSQALYSGMSPETSAQSSQVKKVVWWRFHGPSAIAPGLKRVTLKVRLDNQRESVNSPTPLFPSQPGSLPFPVLGNIVDEGGMPRRDLMLHLLGVFMTHFGCQYPSLSRSQLERDLDARSGSTLLFNCIASTASRFSKHPEIALPHLEPHSYGLIFLKTAKNMLGNALAVPTRETVIALTLLAGISHGIDSESEEWMAAGMAVRMAIDLGLHLAPPKDASITAEDRRLNLLTFWSVYFLDVSLSFGVGRETAFRLATISQTIPTEDDMRCPDDSTGNNSSRSAATPPVRSAFAYAAKLAFAYGPLVNVINGPWDVQHEWETEAQRITQQAVEVYNALPPDMQWSAYNLQNFSHADQGSIFVQMHLWMHTILASGYLVGTDHIRPDRGAFLHGSLTPSNTTSTRLWQNSARTIGDILVLADIVNPFVYHALPFSNQPFVVAGCCYIKEADAQRQRPVICDQASADAPFDRATSISPGEDDDVAPSEPIGSDVGASQIASKGKEQEEKAGMFRTLLQSVTTNNIAALRQGLIRQTRYWAGVAWVAEVLAQRMSGVSMDDIDLKTVTEGLDSTVTITDARMFGQTTEVDEMRQHDSVVPADAAPTADPFNVNLPLEADWVADTAMLQSLGYPVTVEVFSSDWNTLYN